MQMAWCAYWPVWSLWLVYLYTRQFGAKVAATSQVSISRQVLDQVRLSWFASISPYYYYTYRLFAPESKAKASAYMQDHECVHLIRHLNRRTSNRTREIIGNKVTFGEFCEREALPAPTTILFSKNGTLTYSCSAEEFPPEEDFFIKPVRGYGGLGTALCEYAGDGFYRLFPSRSVLHRAHVQAWVAALAKQHEIIVQPRLANHPSVADLSSGALISARILTGYSEGRAEAIRATLKIPLGDAVTNNYGLAAPIDVETGRVGGATLHGPDDVLYEAHPETGARIAGRLLEGWDSAVAQTTVAHQKLPDMPFIGWDIAFCNRGWLLLEGNENWGAEFLQKPHRNPLLDTKFTDICFRHQH